MKKINKKNTGNQDLSQIFGEKEVVNKPVNMPFQMLLTCMSMKILLVLF